MKIENTKKNNLSFGETASKLKEFYRPFYGPILVILALGLLQEILGLVAPYIYGRIIDGVISKHALWDVLNLAAIFFVTYMLNEVIVSYIRQRVEIEKFDSDFTDSVNRKTLDRVLKFSIGQHENQNSGIKKSILDRGTNALVRFTNDWFYQVLPLFLQVVVTVTALTIIAPPLGLIVLAGITIFIGLCFLTNKILGPQMSKFQEMRNDIDKKHAEFLRSASLIKLNAKEKEIEQEYSEQLGHANKAIKSVWLKYIHQLTIRITIIDITRTAVMVLGIYMVYQGLYTPGFLVVFLSWSTNAFARLWTVGYLQRNIIEDWSAIKNLFSLLNSEIAIREAKDPILLKQIKGDIEYKNVSFKYPSREVIVSKKLKPLPKLEDHTLKNVNILIKAGERVAIVGHSGAGKSSLVQLLIRAYDPDKGKILIDGNDLKDLSLENYRSQLGVVPQDVSLFDESLRYNILFGAKENVSDKRLNQAIKMARVEGFLKDLENGLDTLIGEKGVKLSGGERQRVGIARALVKNPSILIFDEATSSLDVENEALIRESIEEASKGRTTIIIAHRLSTIKDADKIIVLEKGKVIAEGKHAHLLKTCEPYKKMINIQTVMVGDE